MKPQTLNPIHPFLSLYVYLPPPLPRFYQPVYLSPPTIQSTSTAVRLSVLAFTSAFITAFDVTIQVGGAGQVELESEEGWWVCDEKIFMEEIFPLEFLEPA